MGRWLLGSDEPSSGQAMMLLHTGGRQSGVPGRTLNCKMELGIEYSLCIFR
jgi:hypothetical protein